MNDLSDQDVTKLLRAWNLGEGTALSRLVPIVYRELHRLAHGYLSRRRPGDTLETAGLINEAYLRLADLHKIEWRDRSHFYAVSASLMRWILVDRARAWKAEKRGGNRLHLPIDEVVLGHKEKDLDLLALDEALVSLSKIDERKARVVELRYFGGLGVKETAKVLQVSPATVVRDWEFSKVWLVEELKGRSLG